MLNFEERTGPAELAAAVTYPPTGQVPQWYTDAKLGAFIHWGLFSVPAWAVTHGDRAVPVEDSYAWHQYAEWYGNTVRITGSPTWRRHQELYGPGTAYEDFADMWKAESFDADDLVGMLADAGARYIVPTTKHHEGFCLWDTDTTGFNAVKRGPRRDLVAAFHEASRARGLRFGVYFSGAHDWHAADYPPIESDTDLFRFRRNDPLFARYATSQIEELIARFSPDILWNDIDWPDGGKGPDEYGLAALFTRYFDAVPHGVVNDRWGIPYHGFLTREYRDVPDILPVPWESTRGLGLSFGYNQDEDASHTLSGPDLIRLFVDIVSKGGNLLINVGPRADGSLPDLQRATLAALGTWMGTNGTAIYGTRPWIRAAEPTGNVRYTQADGVVWLHCLNPASGEVVLPEELTRCASVRWLGADTIHTPLDSPIIPIPDTLRGEPVAVLELR